jgi:hypothetical protein
MAIIFLSQTTKTKKSFAHRHYSVIRVDTDIFFRQDCRIIVSGAFFSCVVLGMQDRMVVRGIREHAPRQPEEAIYTY